MKKLITLILILALALPALALADESFSILGRWSLASSYDEIINGYMLAKTDLIFFDDGNVFRFTVTKKNKDNDLTINHDVGIWVGDIDNMVIRFNNKTFKAYTDEDGLLYLENDGITNKFFRIQYIE